MRGRMKVRRWWLVPPWWGRCAHKSGIDTVSSGFLLQDLIDFLQLGGRLFAAAKVIDSMQGEGNLTVETLLERGIVAQLRQSTLLSPIWIGSHSHRSVCSWCFWCWWLCFWSFKLSVFNFKVILHFFSFYPCSYFVILQQGWVLWLWLWLWSIQLDVNGDKPRRESKKPDPATLQNIKIFWNVRYRNMTCSEANEIFDFLALQQCCCRDAVRWHFVGEAGGNLNLLPFSSMGLDKGSSRGAKRWWENKKLLR